MKNSIKKRTGIIASICAIALLAGATFALFSTTDDTSTSGHIGSVDVSVTALNVENFENVNPGDNDPDLPEDPEDPRTPGTPHDITFTVSNNGNKSIKTRHVITLSTDDGLDASKFMIINGDSEAVEKFYVIDNADVAVADYDGTSTISAVKYIIASDVFDGKGVSLDEGGSAEKETGAISSDDTDASPSTSYTYKLGMSYDVEKEEYEGAPIHLTVEVQGMQYRNTNNSDWQTIFTDGVTI